MSFRLWPARERDLGALLERCGTDALTYAPAGVSIEDLTPSGLERRHWTTALTGSNAFERAVGALRTWEMHCGARLRIAADGPIAIGTNVAFSAPLPIGFIDGTCRIVAVADEPNRYGFAYGTLPVHPECGEEAFILSRDAAAMFVSTSTQCRGRRNGWPGSSHGLPTLYKTAQRGATSLRCETSRATGCLAASHEHEIRPRRIGSKGMESGHSQ